MSCPMIKEKHYVYRERKSLITLLHLERCKQLCPKTFSFFGTTVVPYNPEIESVYHMPCYSETGSILCDLCSSEYSCFYFNHIFLKRDIFKYANSSV